MDALNDVTFLKESVDFEDLDGPPGDKVENGVTVRRCCWWGLKPQEGELIFKLLD